MAIEVQEIAGKFFDFARREYLFHRNDVTTYFDVFAQRGSVALAFEVETTSRHAVDNARKASLVGIPLWFVVPRRRLKLELTRKLKPLDLRPGGEPIKILLLAQLEQELRNYLSLFIPANKQNRKE
jgi:hypothetical protein